MVDDIDSYDLYVVEKTMDLLWLVIQSIEGNGDMPEDFDLGAMARSHRYMKQRETNRDKTL